MPNSKRPLFNVQLTDEQAQLMLDALEEKLTREGDDRRRAVIYAIELVLCSGINHSKER